MAVNEPARKRIGLPEVIINFHFAGIFHSHPCRLHIQHFQKRVVVLVEQNRRARGRAQFHGSAHMIDVSMSDHDLLDFQVMFFDQSENVIDIVAGVDHHRFASDIVPDDGAIALQGSDRKDFVNHGSGLQVFSRQSSVFSSDSRLTSRLTT